MIGGNGPRMLKVAAHYADTWNTFGGMDVKSFDEMLIRTRDRNTRLDEYCSEIGRDPTTLRRSVLIFTNEEYQRIYSIPGAFEEIVKRYLEMGFAEIIFFYPFAPILMPMFEQIVNEAIPKLRSIKQNSDLFKQALWWALKYLHNKYSINNHVAVE